MQSNWCAGYDETPVTAFYSQLQERFIILGLLQTFQIASRSSMDALQATHNTSLTCLLLLSHSATFQPCLLCTDQRISALAATQNCHTWLWP
jgi:hypothetical protein